MSETTDSLVVIVSEETGQLTIARGGELEHNLSTQEVRGRIDEYLSNLDEAKNKSHQTRPNGKKGKEDEPTRPGLSVD